VRRRNLAIPLAAARGGSDRRRRYRHAETLPPANDPAVERPSARTPIREAGDVEDFIYEAWGAHQADAVSER
jgi:hypothetical protein